MGDHSLPFLQAKFQLSYFLVGIIVLVSNVSSSFIQPVFGYISDKMAMRWIIPVGCLVAGAGMLARKDFSKGELVNPGKGGQAPVKTAAVLQASEYAGRAWKAVMLLIGVVTIRSWTQVGISTFLPLFLVNYAQKTHEYSSTMLAVFLIAGGVGTIVGGPAADRWGRKTVIMLSMLLTPLLLLLWLKLPGFWSPVFLALAGAVIVATFSVTVVFCQELLPRNIGMAGGLMMGFAIGMGGVGATVLGFLADRWGLLNTLYLTASLPLAGLFLAAFLPGRAVHKEARLG